MSSDSEALNAQARLEWEIIVSNLSEAISDVGRFNTALGNTFKTGNDLEGGLVKVYSAVNNLASAQKDGASVANQYSDEFAALNAQLVAFNAEQRQAAQDAVAFNASLDGTNKAGIAAAYSITELREFIATNDAKNQSAIAVAKSIVSAFDQEAAGVAAANAAEVASIDATVNAYAAKDRAMAASLAESASANRYVPGVGPAALTGVTASDGLTAEQQAAMAAAYGRTTTAVAANTEALAANAAADAAAGIKATELAAQQDLLSNTFGKVEQGISGQRHALDAASTSLATFGAGLIAIPVISALIASDYQRDFANVQRATLLPVAAANTLKNSLIELSTEVPETFKAITQIATAGAQLGIPDSGLVQFTTVVAKLTATTQISAVAAENLFQKFYVLAGVKPDNFENLASAILNVSIHTGAAEAQVSLLATRIIGVAQQAGFTVPQVIALSAAFGSISAQSASYQMGTIVRLVGNLQGAVEGAGPALDAFAKTAGLTDEQVQKTFGTSKFAPYFLDFITGLNNTKKSGGDVLAILDDMGIKSIRDRAAILNLADAHATLAKAMTLADQGYANSSLLNLHFQQVNETLKSQVTEMISTFGDLGNQLGAISTGPLTNIVDGIIDVTKAFVAFENNPWGQGVTAVVAGGALILGSLVLITSAAGKVGASFLAIGQAANAPVLLINKAYAQMVVGADAAAAANERLAASEDAVAASADAEAAQVAAASTVTDVAGKSGAFSILGKIGALLGGTAAGGLVSSFAPIAAGGVAFVAAADFGQQLAETTATQDGLTTSAQKYSDQLKKGAGDIDAYAQVLGDLNSQAGGRQDPNIRNQKTGAVLPGLGPADYEAGLVNSANLDKAMSTAPAADLVTEYAKLIQAGKLVGDSASYIADKFPLATAAYKNAIAANAGLATAAQQAAEGIHNTATEALQIDNDFGGATAVTKLEASITKSLAPLSGMKVALSDLTSPAKVVTESLKSVTKELNTNTTTANTWSANLRTVTLQYGTDVANQFIAAGASGTNESLLAQLVKATPAQGAAYKTALLNNLKATSGAVAQQQLEAADIVSKSGKPIGAAEASAIQAELTEGVDFRDVAASWGIQLAAQPALSVTIQMDGDTTGAAAAANAFFNQFANSAAAANHWVGNTLVPVTFKPIAPSINSKGTANKGYADGGPTGPGSDNEVAGVVHANEFVFSAPAVRKIGLANLAFAHNMAKSGHGYQDGGFTGGGSDLSGMGGPSHVAYVEINQNNPLTRDPLKQLRQSSENVAAGIWGN